MLEIASTCPYCGVGCGVDVSIAQSVDPNRAPPLVLASKSHPANFGRLCSKGSALAETLVGVKKGRRLTHPIVDKESVSWDKATKTIAQKIKQSIADFGKDSVAFYLSGQLLTEDYYVANKLMKGFIGTANVDTNSRLCMSSAVAGYKRAFGSDSVPCCYEDLELADLIVLIGSNAAWTHPVLYQRMVAAKQTNPNLKVVLIDPRKTASNDLADLHLPLAPSSDEFLFQGLLNYLIDSNAIDQSYIDKYTEGFDLAVEQVKGVSLEEVLENTELEHTDLLTFFKWFADTKKVVSFYSQGINQSATGTNKCNAIINCHLATGSLGIAGAGPFSITGQPNAMGGREVGGLANQLAAHMDFEPDDIDRVKRFWNSPKIAVEPGLKAVDLFDAVFDGQIKVLWIMATNPAVSLPDSNKIRRAMQECETVIISDVCHTDSTQYADILLPALGWSEKDGSVTNSERRISRQRAFCKAPGVAKADWWAMTQVARELGYTEQFEYESPRDIFVEHASLSAFENNGTRDFDISGLSQLSDSEYEELAPIQWPVNIENPHGTKRLFEDNLFYTPNRRAQFVTSTPQLANCLGSDFVLNTGRLRDQWHTMTRTGIAPSLSGHGDVPFVQIHPEDATNLSLQNNTFGKIYNEFGQFIARIEITESVAVGQLFSPIHWTEQSAKDGVVSKLVSPEVDPISGQPESKASQVAIQQFNCARWAKIVSREPLSKMHWDYWVESITRHGFVTLVASHDEEGWIERLNSLYGKENDLTRYVNPLAKSTTLIASKNDQIETMIFSEENAENLPSFIWLEEAVGQPATLVRELLKGEMLLPDELVCACFRTSRKKILTAIKAGKRDLQSITTTLGCGSKCGSCRPEINQLLREKNTKA